MKKRIGYSKMGFLTERNVNGIFSLIVAITHVYERKTLASEKNEIYFFSSVILSSEECFILVFPFMCSMCSSFTRVLRKFTKNFACPSPTTIDDYIGELPGETHQEVILILRRDVKDKEVETNRG